LEEIFDAVIKINGKPEIVSKIEGLDEKVFEEKIKDIECGKVEINGEVYWVIKKENVYIIDKLECLSKFMEEIEKKAIYDSLTECYNKRETEEFIKKFLYNYLRYKNDFFTIMMLDIDYFKKVNDTYGHLAGDFVLKEIAKIIKDSIRKSDICGRFGGEEFVIVLPNTKLSGAMKLAERIRETIQNHTFDFNGKKINVTVSIGITSVGVNDSYESLISRADEALYEAKEKGRNRIEYR
jgi:diguanylate cyclase (GGDEF)-like protein